METFQVYTAGSTKHVSNDESYQWRKSTRDCLEKVNEKYNVNVFIPSESFNYDTLLPKTEKQCMNYFLHKVSKSDLLLVNLDNSNSSVGTGMEVQKAFDTGIPIIGFGTKNIYPWIKEHCDIVFEDRFDALVYIKEYYLL